MSGGDERRAEPGDVAGLARHEETTREADGMGDILLKDAIGKAAKDLNGLAQVLEGLGGVSRSGTKVEEDTLYLLAEQTSSIGDELAAALDGTREPA